jgi:hypothetical protein
MKGSISDNNLKYLPGSFDKSPNSIRIKNQKLSSTEVYKSIFSKETGDILKNIQIEKLKINVEESNKVKLDPVKLKKLNYESSKNILAKYSLSMNNKDFSSKSMNIYNNELISNNLNNQPNLYMTSSDESFKDGRNIYSNRVNLRPIKEHAFYCPNCPHCNATISDEFLEKHINDTKEAFNIIKRGSEYLIEHSIESNTYQDLFSIFNSENKKEKNKNEFSVEEFLNEYTRHMNSRTNYLQTINFLQALVDDKIDINKFLSTISIDKYNSNLFYQGRSFDEEKGNFEFEKELEGLFDENMKDMVKKIFKSIKFNLIFRKIY